MARSIAFLRAINVGGRVVTMERLREIVAAAGFSNVESYIASGNIIVDAGRGARRTVERTIERALESALGYEVATFIRSAREVAGIVAYRPFSEGEPADGSSLFVAFLADAPGSEAVEHLMAYTTDDDSFHVHGREAYWLRRGRSSDSKFTLTHLERALGMKGTMRNITTLRKLSERYPPS